MTRLSSARSALIGLVVTALAIAPLCLIPDSAAAAPGQRSTSRIYPRPQAEQRLSGSVRITPTARLVAGPGTDPAAKQALIDGLSRRGIGVRALESQPRRAIP